jgi:hypothetical protein
MGQRTCFWVELVVCGWRGDEVARVIDVVPLAEVRVCAGECRLQQQPMSRFELGVRRGDDKRAAQDHRLWQFLRQGEGNAADVEGQRPAFQDFGSVVLLQGCSIASCRSAARRGSRGERKGGSHFGGYRCCCCWLAGRPRRSRSRGRKAPSAGFAVAACCWPRQQLACLEARPPSPGRIGRRGQPGLPMLLGRRMPLPATAMVLRWLHGRGHRSRSGWSYATARAALEGPLRATPSVRA